MTDEYELPSENTPQSVTHRGSVDPVDLCSLHTTARTNIENAMICLLDRLNNIVPVNGKYPEQGPRDIGNHVLVKYMYTGNQGRWLPYYRLMFVHDFKHNGLAAALDATNPDKPWCTATSMINKLSRHLRLAKQV